MQISRVHNRDIYIYHNEQNTVLLVTATLEPAPDAVKIQSFKVWQRLHAAWLLLIKLRYYWITRDIFCILQSVDEWVAAIAGAVFGWSSNGTLRAVLRFQPKYRLAHPEKYLFSLSKKYILWIKVSNKYLIWCWKKKHWLRASSGFADTHMWIKLAQ